MVSGASIAVMIGGIIFIFVLVIGLMLYYNKKHHAKISAFFIGAATFFLFALVLEQLMHVLVLYILPLGKPIQNNIWLYALYGGLSAGVFEETGRLVAMKLLLKKDHDKPQTALMYGTGHGGIEALLLGALSLASNLVIACMINAGQEQTLLHSLPEEQTIITGLEQLKETAPLIFAAVPAERLSAVILHIALSVLVWTAVVKKKPLMFFLAVFLHFFVDAAAVLLKDRLSIPVLELLIFIASVLVALLAFAVWKRNLTGIPAESPVPEDSAS